MRTDTILERGLTAPRERKYVDFKAKLDLGNLGDVCEIVKDIVAMANSGGGVILVGVANNGSPTDFDPTDLLAHDPAKLIDQLAKYTGRQFAEWEIGEAERQDRRIAVVLIQDAGMPMVFTKAGTYVNERNIEKVAFQNGTIYVRHGAKSEPANPDDLAAIINPQVEQTRRRWMDGIRKVTTAPADHVVLTGPPGSTLQPSTKAPSDVARIVGDPTAPAVYPTQADDTWPHRGKELIGRVNQRLEGRTTINTHDIQAVRIVHSLETEYPELAHRPFQRTPPQYSDQCIDWLVEQYDRNPNFFADARARYKRMKGEQ
ncbi:MAG TPA: RNA-binding domain-containing protein [Thermoanaerobaculia bacterium]|nr:RNA-binding domain-containing protein [Thermoanaerobaculia bacterium]